MMKNLKREKEEEREGKSRDDALFVKYCRQ